MNLPGDPTGLVPAPRNITIGDGSFPVAGARVEAAPGYEAVGRLLEMWLATAGRGVGASREEGASRVDGAGGAVAGAGGGDAVGGAGGGDAVGGAGGAAVRGGTGSDGLVRIAHDPSLPGPEEYRLDISREAIVLAAASREGALNGASTIRQLLLSQGSKLPILSIEDGPRFSWRGAMLDSARNFQRVEFIEKFLDLMALHKLNRFHWHLTDDQGWRLDIPSMPEIAQFGSRRQERRVNIPRMQGGFYTRDDVRRIVDFAGERGIVVVPEIETPGHAIALLASHPELSCKGGAGDGNEPFVTEWRHGVFGDVLCAGNEKVFEILGRVFDEVAALFPGPWVHAGGDEVPKARWSSCPKCRAVMKSHNLRDEGGALEPEYLQGWFMNRVAALLAERGKRMIGWDEILEGRPRKDAIVISWRGYSGGVEAARLGHEVVMSPQTKACYLDHKHLDLSEEPGQLGVCTVRDSYSFEPVPESLGPAEAALITGGQANIWTELMPFARHVEYMAFPRLSALSEAFWSPKENRNWDEFVQRLEIHGRRLDALDVNRYRGALE